MNEWMNESLNILLTPHSNLFIYSTGGKSCSHSGVASACIKRAHARGALPAWRASMRDPAGLPAQAHRGTRRGAGRLAHTRRGTTVILVPAQATALAACTCILCVVLNGKINTHTQFNPAILFQSVCIFGREKRWITWCNRLKSCSLGLCNKPVALKATYVYLYLYWPVMII